MLINKVMHERVEMKFRKLNARFDAYTLGYTAMYEYEKKEKPEAFKIIKVLVEMYGEPIEWFQRGGWGYWKHNYHFMHSVKQQRIYLRNEADRLAIQLKMS